MQRAPPNSPGRRPPAVQDLPMPPAPVAPPLPPANPQIPLHLPAQPPTKRGGRKKPYLFFRVVPSLPCDLVLFISFYLISPTL